MPLTQEQLNEMAKSLPALGSDPKAVRARVEALEAQLSHSGDQGAGRARFDCRAGAGLG
jgi:hypothetical protein